MADDILLMKPVFKQRIWGGSRLDDVFGYDIPGPDTGECWCISAHPNGPSLINGGPYDGTSLDGLYHDHPELFGYPESPSFPLLVKILDAKDDLSVQVHPGDRTEHGLFMYGKSECWRILDAPEDAHVILGHRARTREEFEKMARQGRYDELLIKKPVKTGDMIDVPAGTVHALMKGTLVLETQQSSDVTYRIHDYDRTDKDGMKRDLHLDAALSCITFPHRDPEPSGITVRTRGAESRLRVRNPHFTLWEVEVTESVTIRHVPYLLMSAIEGIGSINGAPFAKGDHFIKTVMTDTVILTGRSTWIISYPETEHKEAKNDNGTHLEFE